MVQVECLVFDFFLPDSTFTGSTVGRYRYYDTTVVKHRYTHHGNTDTVCTPQGGKSSA